MKTAIGTVLLAAAVCIPASARTLPQTTWPQYQYAADHNAVFDLPAWKVSWRSDIGKKTNGGLSIVGTTLYVESFDHRVYAFNALTGQQLWSQVLVNVAMNTPIVANGMVFAGTGVGGVLYDSPTFWVGGRPEGDSYYGLQASTGRIVWKFDTVGFDMATGVFDEVAGKDEFIFANGDDHVYALDPASGRMIWKIKTLGHDGMSALALDADRIFGISTLGMGGFFEEQRSHPERSRLWNWTYAFSPGALGQFYWTVPYGVADASPTVGDGVILVQGFRLISPTGAAAADRSAQVGWGYLANAEARWALNVNALDESTGKHLWSYDSAPGPNVTTSSATFTSDAVFADGVAFEPLPMSRELAAFAVKSGRLLWKIAVLDPIKTSPVVKDGMLYVGDGGGHFYIVSAADGKIVRTLTFPGGDFGRSPPVIVGQTLFVANAHYVYAMPLTDLQNGVVPP